jgi:hypothetical protein
MTAAGRTRTLSCRHSSKGCVRDRARRCVSDTGAGLEANSGHLGRAPGGEQAFPVNPCKMHTVTCMACLPVIGRRPRGRRARAAGRRPARGAWPASAAEYQNPHGRVQTGRRCAILVHIAETPDPLLPVRYVICIRCVSYMEGRVRWPVPQAGLENPWPGSKSACSFLPALPFLSRCAQYSRACIVPDCLDCL